MLRRQDGQIIPALMMVMLALIVLGMLFFQVGRAAIFSTTAQTAADAAALAAVKNVEAQLDSQVHGSGSADLSLVDSAQVLAAAEAYAQKNGAHVVKIDRNGVDVKVWVITNDRLGRGAKRLDLEDTHGTARARARVELLTLPGSGGNQNMGALPTGGDPTISSAEWSSLGKKISHPPTCGSSAASNDLVTLGRLLQKHGFAVGENAEMGDNPAPGVHEAGGYHYKCRNSGALDVNHDQFNEKGVIDAIVAPVQKLGFRTIWQAAGHFDHIHIDVANSGPIGAGFGTGGAVGALEETTLGVHLIDWDSDYLPFGGIGYTGSGGSFGGASRSGRRAHDLLGARPLPRAAEGAARGLRGGDRGVRRPQPQLRRRGLARRLSAAAERAGLGHGGADHGPRARGDDVHHQRDPQERVAVGGAARAGRAGLQVPGPLRRGGVAGGRDAPEVLRGLVVSADHRSRAVAPHAPARPRRPLTAGLAVLAALWCAGCGVLDDTGPAVPQAPPQALTRPNSRVTPNIDPPHVRPTSRRVAAALDGGSIGVVDITGTVGVRPATLETASDGRLMDLSWSSWGADGAVGHGTMRSLDCPSTCADGTVSMIPATIRLSGVTKCSGRLYFAAGAVELQGAKPPATYLRAPC